MSFRLAWLSGAFRQSFGGSQVRSILRWISVALCVIGACVAVTGSATGASRTTATLVLRGVDSQNIRPFTLAHDSDVLWSCPGCSQSNFIFETNETPGVVNALNHTHGLSFLSRGRYTGVSIVGSGSWTITLRTAAKRPVVHSYVLSGVDSTNVKPFTLTHDSNVIWSCPDCSQSNFIFETNESPGVVNALNHTHGSSFLPKGHYTGVSVTATGSWTIKLR